MKSVVYQDCPYYHDNKNISDDKKITLYHLEEFSYEDRKPSYVITESENNQGLGFGDWKTRDGVAKDVAGAIREAHDYTADQVDLYQQRPDGNFDRVGFREIGRDGFPSADKERSVEEPDWKQSENPPKEVQWSEHQRTVYTPEEVEKNVGSALAIMPEVPKELKDLSGPAIDRPAEKRADVQRRQEQDQQLNQHQKEHCDGIDL